MPTDEVHLRLEGRRVAIRPPSKPPDDVEVAFDLDIDATALPLLRFLRECLCIQHPDHPSNEKWFHFFGEHLAKRFPDKVVRCLAHDRDTRIRVFLKIALPDDEDSRALRDAPWELLRFDTGLVGTDALGTSSRLTFTRLLDVPPLNPVRAPTSSSKNLRVLLIDAGRASPKDKVLDGEKVRRDIKGQTNAPVKVWTPAELRECYDDAINRRKTALTQEEFDIVHVLAHGAMEASETAFVLDADTPMTATQLADALAGRCRAVVLQSCSTVGAAPALLRRGIEAVVAMAYDIELEKTLPFFNELYSALANREAIDAAVQNGRSALLTKQRGPSFAAPVLFARSTQLIRFQPSQLDQAAAQPMEDNDRPSARPPQDVTQAVKAPVPPQKAPTSSPTIGIAQSLIGVRAGSK